MVERYPIRWAMLNIDDPPTEEIRRSIAAWRSWRGARRMPAWTQPDLLLDLPAPVLPSTTVAESRPGHAGFVYRFWGSAFTQVHGEDMTGRPVSELKPTRFAEIVTTALERVSESREPQLYATETLNFARIPIHEYVLRLPMSADDVIVDKVISICWMDVRELTDWFTEASNHDQFAT